MHINGSMQKHPNLTWSTHFDVNVWGHEQMDPLGSLNILSIKQKINILWKKSKKNTTWRQTEEGSYMDNAQS